MFKKILNALIYKEPVQLPLNFGSNITFKDCIRKISTKHGSRGSLLISALKDHVDNKEFDYDQWKVDEFIKNYHKEA
tara:strand:+ start:243 stop:473 length:231 start_codon:yes stop_codon:yes gene_type:complete